MPVVVIAALIFAVSAVSLPFAPAQSCAIKDGALPHFGLMSEMSRNDDPERAALPDSQTQSEPAQSPTIARDIPEIASPAVVEPAAEPAGMPRAVILVAIAIIVTIGIIEVLFRCTIPERPRSADHRQTE
jgi:hypothetical protein